MTNEDIKSVEITNNKDYFTYRWSMGKFCNYRCSYCFQKHDIEKPDVDKLKAQAYEIVDLIERTKSVHNKKVRLSLMGGEISILPLAEIVAPLIDHIDMLSFVSNGSGNFDDLIELCRDKVEIRGDLSFHDEFTTVDKFTNKVVELRNKNPKNRWIILSVITNRNYVVNKLLYNACKKLHISLSINLERKSDGSSEIMVTNKKCLDFVKQIELEKNRCDCIVTDMNGNPTYYSSRRDFQCDHGDLIVKGWSCNLNSNILFINENSEVYTSFCKQENKTPIKDFVLNLTPLTCFRLHCPFCFPLKVIKPETNNIQ